MLTVGEPVVPPPVKPAPAVTPSISPARSASIVNVPAASSYVAVTLLPPTISPLTISSMPSSAAVMLAKVKLVKSAPSPLTEEPEIIVAERSPAPRTTS